MAQGDIIKVHTLPIAENKEDGVRLLIISSEGGRGSGHMLKQKPFKLTM